MREWKAQVNTLAAAQCGVLSRAQALESGLSSAAIGRRLSSGQWIRVLPGTYRLASAPRSWNQWLLAAWLWAGESAVVSHRAAAALLGLAGISCTFAELWVPGALKSPSRAIRLHTTQDLPRTDFYKSGPLLVTTATRTLIDLGAIIDSHLLEAALEDALHRGLVSVPRLEKRLHQMAGPGRRGPGALQKVLKSRASGGPAESRLEVKALQALRDSGIPLPQRQYRIQINGADHRLDLAYPELKIAIELDGVKHHLTRTGWDGDRAKNNRLNLSGWTVIRATWGEVQAGTFVGLVAQALSFRNGYRSPSGITKKPVFRR